MNVSQWGIGQLMQLPDCFFGSRFGVFVGLNFTAPGTNWDISEIAIPEKCVIWEVHASACPFMGTVADFRLALGDQLPTNTAMMDLLEPLLPGLGLQGAEPRQFSVGGSMGVHLVNLRKPLVSMGRRLVLEVVMGAGDVTDMKVDIVVSSMPTEVPDCLLSGLDKSRM